jgi:hypothetical protein
MRKRKNQIRIIEFALKNGKLPSKYSKDIVERRLGYRVADYGNISSKQYDPNFINFIKIHFYVRKYAKRVRYNKTETVKELLDFIEKNKRTPSSKIESEKRLYSYLANYTTISSNQFDENVLKNVLKLDPFYGLNIRVNTKNHLNGLE